MYGLYLSILKNTIRNAASQLIIYLFLLNFIPENTKKTCGGPPVRRCGFRRRRRQGSAGDEICLNPLPKKELTGTIPPVNEFAKAI